MVLGNLEALAGRLACENATDAEIHEVRQMHDRMMELYAEAATACPISSSTSASTRPSSASRRTSRSAYVHGILQARLRRIRYIGNEGPEKWAGAVADHEEMIAALEARDADRLSRF